MKLRVQLTVHVTEDELRLINIHRTKVRDSDLLATEEQVREFFREYGVGIGRKVLDALAALHPPAAVIKDVQDDSDEEELVLRDAG